MFLISRWGKPIAKIHYLTLTKKWRSNIKWHLNIEWHPWSFFLFRLHNHGWLLNTNIKNIPFCQYWKSVVSKLDCTLVILKSTINLPKQGLFVFQLITHGVVTTITCCWFIVVIFNILIFYLDVWTTCCFRNSSKDS